MNKEKLLKIVGNCRACGQCQEFCPTYKVSGREYQLARGRNRLIKLVLENKLDLAKESRLQQYLNECLLCGACVEKCPCGVDTPYLISKLRAETVRIKDLPLGKKIMLTNMFADNKKIDKTMKIIRFYQNSGAKRVFALSKASKNISSKLVDVPKQNARASLKKTIFRPLYLKEQVAYFLGCSVDNFFPKLAISTIKVLQENNYEVLVPDVKCCGAAHFSMGKREESINLAKKNLKILLSLQVDVIIVDCQTCGAMLQNYTKLFKDDPILKEMADKIHNKVIDISTFLLKKGYKKEMAKLTRRVTYHDPCNGVRHLKVKNAPRKILESIEGIEFVEMEEAQMCCGGAGLYGVFNSEISGKIIDLKLGFFKNTGASIIATSCPACAIQLKSGIEKQGLLAEVKHPVELLALAYENK